MLQERGDNLLSWKGMVMETEKLYKFCIQERLKAWQLAHKWEDTKDEEMSSFYNGKAKAFTEIIRICEEELEK